jgi:hypothetical protein
VCVSHVLEVWFSHITLKATVKLTASSRLHSSDILHSCKRTICNNSCKFELEYLPLLEGGLHIHILRCCLEVVKYGIYSVYFSFD